MNVINENCRLCLKSINHEPIKITRLLFQFIEQTLQFSNITRHEPHMQHSKLYMCAVCFNKMSEFQEFYELCKEADAFWHCRLESASSSVDNSSYYDLVTTTVELLGASNGKDNIDDIDRITKKINESDILFVNDVQNENVIEYDMENWSETIVNEECISNEIDDHIEIIKYEDGEYEATTAEPSISSITNGDTIQTTKKINFDNQYTDEILYEADNEFAHETLGKTIRKFQLCNELIIEQTEDSNQSYYQEFQHSEESGSSQTYSQYDPPILSKKPKKCFQCNVCGKSFDRTYDLEIHMHIHNNVRPYVCQVCGKAFRQKNILTTHQAIHFGKKVECTECGKRFARKSQLILHNRMHRDEKPFTCDFNGCNAAFRQRQHLIDHRFVHSNEKNFQCTLCQKAFHMRKRLQDHIYKVHSLHRYGCNSCTKTFLKPHMLRNHLALAHKIEIADVSHLKTTTTEDRV